MTELTTELTDARNVFLSAPSMSGGETEACTDLLHPVDGDDVNVLWVSYRRDPATCLEQWAGGDGSRPRNATVLAVGESLGPVDVEGVTVQTVSSPSDLTGLGIEIGETLSAWDGELAVCFDSLTALLQYVDVETVYEFLHTITGQLYAADATAHFHIDPTAHDDQTVSSITSLFDAVVSVGGGERQIRQRQLLE
jgi:hypothetical protein